jgi:hypothetical protein
MLPLIIPLRQASAGSNLGWIRVDLFWWVVPEFWATWVIVFIEFIEFIEFIGVPFI